MARISIIINNYNYGKFLRQCVESTLTQTVSAHEIIVVDDGSTDNSLQIIKEFEGQVTVIDKRNAGQASAMNAGFEASTGGWIWFLDADDWLHPSAIEIVSRHLSYDYSKIQGRLLVVDETLGALGEVPKYADKPFDCAPAKAILEDGGFPRIPPTSGNVFARSFLDDVMPIPNETYQICADEYLNYASLARQKLFHTPEILGYYRSHGNNAYLSTTLFHTDEKMILKRIDSVIRPRVLFLSQFPEVHERGEDFPFSLNHLKTMVTADRVLVGRANTLPLNRQEIKAAYKKRIRSIKARKSRAKECLAYWILCYAPFWLINLVGILEIGVRALCNRKLPKVGH